MKLAEARKTPYAWPGGYAVHALMGDGEIICHRCLQEPDVHENEGHGWDRGWRYDSPYIHWEGPDEYCAHCGVALPSEYGDDQGSGPEHKE